MEKIEFTKKALRSLVKDTMRDGISKLELPKSNKKVKKIIERSSKKIAAEFSVLLKKENKRNKKAEKSLTYIEDVLIGKEKKSKAKKKSKEITLEQIELAEAKG